MDVSQEERAPGVVVRVASGRRSPPAASSGEDLLPPGGHSWHPPLPLFSSVGPSVHGQGHALESSAAVAHGGGASAVAPFLPADRLRGEELYAACQEQVLAVLDDAVMKSVYAQLEGAYLSPVGEALRAWITGNARQDSGGQGGGGGREGGGKSGGSGQGHKRGVGAAESDEESAARGGRLARGWCVRADPAGRLQWLSVVNTDVIATEKPTVKSEGAVALASYLRGTADEDALLALLTLSLDVYAPHRALAAACVAQVMEGRPGLASSSAVMARLLLLLRKEPRARVREALFQVLALVALKGEADGVVTRGLLSNLDDPDRRCRAQVAECLVAVTSPEGQPAAALLRRLAFEAADQDAVWYGRETAINTMALLATTIPAARQECSCYEDLWEGLWQVLRQLARSDKMHVGSDNEYLRAAAIKALGTLAPPHHRESFVLAANLLADEHSEVRAAAVRAIEALQAHHAASSVPPPGKKDGEGGGGSRVNEELVAILMQHVLNADVNVRVCSFEALAVALPPGAYPDTGSAGPSASTPLPSQPAAHEAGSQARSTAGVSGTAGGSSPQVSSLSSAGKIKDRGLAMSADLFALVDLRMAEALKDPSPEVRQAAAHAVLCCASKNFGKTMEATIETLQTTDVSIPPSFASPALQPLLQQQEHEQEKVEQQQQEEATSGGALGEEHVNSGPVGIRKVRAGEERGERGGGEEDVHKGKLQGMHLAAGKVVQQLSSKVHSFAQFEKAVRASGVLVEFARVERPEIRLLLLESLEKKAAGQTAALGAALLQLLDLSPQIRVAAVNAVAAVAAVGSRGAITAIGGLLTDPDRMVRASAGAALLVLSRLDDENTVALLLPQLEESSNSRASASVRNRAAVLLTSVTRAGNDTVRHALEKNLSNPNPHVRVTAIQGLVEMLAADKPDHKGTRVTLNEQLALLTRAHQAATGLVHLLSDPEWLVALCAARGILRLESHRLIQEIVSKGRVHAEHVSGPLKYKNSITQGLLALLERTSDEAELLHQVGLEVMDEILAKDDVEILEHLVKNLIHPHSRVRHTALAGIQTLANGSGLKPKLEALGVRASGKGSGKLKGSKHFPPSDESDAKEIRYDAVVTACSNFINELTVQTRACAALEMEALAVQVALQRPGADKEALSSQLRQLRDKIHDLQLSEEERGALAGSLQAVMGCLRSVVPAANESATACVVACLEDESYDVRMCALNNLRAVAGEGNVYAMAQLVQRLTKPYTHVRWAAAEGLIVVGGKGHRQLLSWILMTMDGKDILDPFVRFSCIGAATGVLLPDDFASVVIALGSDQDKQGLEVLLAEKAELQAAFDAEEAARKSATKALAARRQEAIRLRDAISRGKADLESEAWVDAQPFWEVINRREFVDQCRQQLNVLQEYFAGTTGPAWDNLQAHIEKLKSLAVKCLVWRVQLEKRRGIIPALLAKHIKGLEPYAGEMSMGVSAALQKKSAGMGKAKTKITDKLTAFKKEQFKEGTKE